MKLYVTVLAALTPLLMSFSGCYAGGKTVINPSKNYVTLIPQHYYKIFFLST